MFYPLIIHTWNVLICDIFYMFVSLLVQSNSIYYIHPQHVN